MIIKLDTDPSWPNWWIVQCSKCMNEISLPLSKDVKDSTAAATPILVRQRWQVKQTGEGFSAYIAAYCRSCKTKEGQ